MMIINLLGLIKEFVLFSIVFTFLLFVLFVDCMIRFVTRLFFTPHVDR